MAGSSASSMVRSPGEAPPYRLMAATPDLAAADHAAASGVPLHLHGSRQMMWSVLWSGVRLACLLQKRVSCNNEALLQITHMIKIL